MILPTSYPTNLLLIILAATVVTIALTALHYWQSRRVLPAVDQPTSSLSPFAIKAFLGSIVAAYLFNQLAQALQRSEISLMSHGAPPNLLLISLRLGLMLWLMYCLVSLIARGSMSKQEVVSVAIILFVLALIIGWLG